MGVSHRSDRAYRRRRRLPDEVRSAAVRAGLAFAFTLVCVMVTILSSLARSWMFLPAVVMTALGVFTSTWCLLEIWIARQIAAQRTWGSGTAIAPSNAAGGGRSPQAPRNPRPPAAGEGRSDENAPAAARSGGRPRAA
jgi:hypothetical protein